MAHRLRFLQMMNCPNGEVLCMSDVKNCPFCGGNASVCEVETDIDGKMFSGFIVACEKCGVSSPASDDEHKVIDCWNKRVPSERENELEKLLVALVNARYDEMNATSRYIRALHKARDFLKTNAD